MGYRILSVASEWFSFHGGLSSFNRSFCAALSSAGHEVVCLIPRASQPEHDDAKRVGVTLIVPEPVPGLSNEALLCLDIELGFQPDIVIGHGHITGAVAAARVRHFHPEAQRIHILHTLPDEIEPFKDRDGEDPSQRAHRKQEIETALSISASIAVAVGPRLHRQWSTYIGGAQNGARVHRLTPGLSDLKPVGSIPQASWCLLMGRLEDAELKGVDLTAAALGLINKDKHFRGQNEVTLVLRGAEPGTSKGLRTHVHNRAGAGIPCTIREYTHREQQVREDIARSSVVLMPSQMEGFGLVGIEALAMGVPILISQRSGLGELLLEMIDADPLLEFARKFIVDVGEGIEKDAERWADAIRSVLTDRERAYKETAVLREAIHKADYWHRAVADLFGVLNVPPRDPKTPPDIAPDLTQWDHKIFDIDPATAIIRSSNLLEREMERVVTSKGIADPALPASQYIEMLRNKGVLNPTEAEFARKVLHLRNMAAHKFDAMLTKDMAQEHLRLVEVLVNKLKSNGLSEASSERVESDLSSLASGNNNTVDNNQNQGASLKELASLIQSIAPAPAANAEIDLAAARLQAGEPDIAIHMLEEMRKKRWDTLSAREKYRTAANMGHALEKKGEFKKSAKYYLEAKEHQPLDEKARAMEAIAYYHLDQKEKAYELAGDVIRDHPNCAIAIAVRIRSAPPNAPLGTLEAIVPSALGGEFEILHALVWRAVATGDSASANRIIDTALRHHPNADEAREQQAVVIVHDEGNAKLTKRPINKERVELAVNTLTAAITKYRGQRHEAHLRHIRAEAYDILGKTEEAAADFRFACDIDEDNPDLVRRFVFFLERHGRTGAAIDALRKADKSNKSHGNRLLLSSLLSDRKQNGDVESAIVLLQEAIAEKPEQEIRTEMVGLLTHLLIDQNQPEKAISYLDALDTSFLSSAALNAIRARVLLRADRKQEAVSIAQHAAQLLGSESPVTERMRVADTLRLVGEKQESLKQWKLVLRPDRINHFVCMALELAREIGDDEFILSFCKQLRAVETVSSFTLELEVVTLEKYGMFNVAIEVMNYYLVATPDGELAKVFRLRLSHLGRRLERPELVESDPAKLPPIESSPVNVGLATAHILRFGPHPEKGIEYAYELVRRHFNDPLARQAYVWIIGVGENEYVFPELSVAGPGCAVKYRADDTGEEKWLIIEDAADPQQYREEYDPNHLWAQEICGKSAGGKFHIRRDQIQPRIATITGIISKYDYRKFEIMDHWEERFPYEKNFFVRKYACPTNADGSPDISVILKALDLKEQQNEEMHALYRANPISATTFATIANAGLLETLSHLASEGLPIRCCLGNDVELIQAETAFSDAEKFILDPSALATLFFREQYEQLQQFAGKVVVCESALNEYAELRQQYTSPSRGFVGKFKGKYLFRDDDPTERKRQEERIDKFLARIKSLVTLRTGETLARIQPERREELIRLFGRPTAEAMAEAAATGAVLWTDDLAVAEFGREITGIGKRVWTQLVFKSLPSQDAFRELTLFLLQWRYTFTRVEPEVVLAACQEASWEPDAPILRQVSGWLSQPELLEAGAAQVCVYSLRLVWKNGPGVRSKQSVARLLLQAIRSRKGGRQAITDIQNNLSMIFEGDKAACSECGSVIHDMLQAERTPREIATSKAIWDKASKIIQRKSGMPDAAHSQTKKDGSPQPKQHGNPKKSDRKRKKRRP